MVARTRHNNKEKMDDILMPIDSLFKGLWEEKLLKNKGYILKKNQDTGIYKISHYDTENTYYAEKVWRKGYTYYNIVLSIIWKK
jgi:hypothetical protein